MRRRQARAAVADFDAQATGVEAGLYAHEAGLGEFAGIADQVVQNLAQAQVVEHQPGRRRVGMVEAQVEAAAFGDGVELVHDVGDQALQVGCLRIQLDLAGLQLRKIEDVGDQALQRLAGLVDAGNAVARFLGQVRHVVQQGGMTQDGGQRRADLVAHIGQEVRLGPLVRLGVFLGGAQRVLEVRLLGDVLQDAEDEFGGAVVVDLRPALGIDDAFLAVGAQQAGLESEVLAAQQGLADAAAHAVAIVGMEQVDRRVDRRLEGGAVQAVDGVGAARPETDLGFGVQMPVADAGHFFHQLQLALGFLQLADGGLPDGVGLAQGQHAGDAFGHLAQPADRRGVEIVARLGIEYAQAADQLAFVAQRGAGVEADVGRVEHERIGGEAVVTQGVGHDQDVAPLQRMLAKRDPGRDRRDRSAHRGNEGVVFAVDQRDQGDRRFKNIGGQGRQVVEAIVRRHLGHIRLAESRIPADVHVPRQRELTHIYALVISLL